ncbi:MAG: GNAT family N-acetyltransferase [Deinococcota bacterium]
MTPSPESSVSQVDATANTLSFREATREDVPNIVRMLADDVLGQTREAYGDPIPQVYWDAFSAINQDPNQHLLVACLEAEVVGTLQLSFLPNMSYQGGWRSLIETVRVDASKRGAGIGKAFIQHAIALSKARGCHMVQLTTNKQRDDAIRFYERLGFTASHEGMKLFV